MVAATLFWLQVTSRNLVPPLRQGDQGSCIPGLRGVDECDSQRWAGGDWGGGICAIHIRTHCDTPLRQGDQVGGILQLLGVDECDSQQWAGGDWGGGIQRMRIRTHCDTPHRQGDWWDGLRRVLEFDLCSVLRRDQRVRVRGVDAALVEQRGPREVPEYVWLFHPMQHSQTGGSCSISRMF